MESVGRSKSKTKKTADAAIKYIILIVVGLLMIYPLLWLIGASFKENNERRDAHTSVLGKESLLIVWLHAH